MSWLRPVTARFRRPARPLRSRFVDSVAAADPAGAGWIRPRLLPWGTGLGTRTGSVVPTGYESYARVFHPPTVEGRPGRWSDVAARTGATAHPGMQWEGIAPLPDADPSRPVVEPETGSLPPGEARVLAGVLGEHTATPGRCWFAVWDGFADVPGTHASRLEHPGREYVVVRGELEAATHPLWRWEGPEAGRYQSPNLWWPDDRAWVVATEIDFRWSYVAGSAECVAALVADPRLEAHVVGPHDRADIAGDTVNPLPPGLVP